MNNKGQTLIEYLLVVITIVAVVSILGRGLIKKIVSPIETTNYSKMNNIFMEKR